MVRLYFYNNFLVLLVCSLCGKEFKSLGRHVWHCKERLKEIKKRMKMMLQMIWMQKLLLKVSLQRVEILPQ